MPQESNQSATAQGQLPKIIRCPACKQEVETRLHTDAWGKTARIFNAHFGHFGTLCARSFTPFPAGRTLHRSADTP